MKRRLAVMVALAPILAYAGLAATCQPSALASQPLVSSTTTLSVSGNPAGLPVHVPVTLTATVTTPGAAPAAPLGGTVHLYDGPYGAGSCHPVDGGSPGTASCSISWKPGAAGAVNLFAAWSGHGTIPGSTSGITSGTACKSCTTGYWQAIPTSVTAQKNVTVEGLPDATLVGQLTSFKTTVTADSCLNGESINVWTAPKEFPHEYVVHNGDQGPQCTYGTWTFPEGATGGWNGVSTALTETANVTVEGLADATLVGQVSDFQTSDPAFGCLDGESINVWTAPKEFPGVYVVHNGDQGSQCTYGTWTFP